MRTLMFPKCCTLHSAWPVVPSFLSAAMVFQSVVQNRTALSIIIVNFSNQNVKVGLTLKMIFHSSGIVGNSQFWCFKFRVPEFFPFKTIEAFVPAIRQEVNCFKNGNLAL